MLEKSQLDRAIAAEVRFRMRDNALARKGLIVFIREELGVGLGVVLRDELRVLSARLRNNSRRGVF
jgi:hypothetical protein